MLETAISRLLTMRGQSYGAFGRTMAQPTAAAVGGRSPSIRRRAALPAPGPETAARCRAAACLTVSEARQTTTPPVSLNFATDSHGVRSGVASSNRCGRPRLIAMKLASCGSPVTARSRWLVRRSKLSPKKCAIAFAGSEVGTSAAAGPGQKNRGCDRDEGGRGERRGPDRAQQRADAAGRSDRRSPRPRQAPTSARQRLRRRQRGRD